VPTDDRGLAESQISYWPLIVVACIVEDGVAPRAALFRSGKLKEALLAGVEGIQAMLRQRTQGTSDKVIPVSCPSPGFLFLPPPPQTA
jgi:hypothetical protein